MEAYFELPLGVSF